jgi:methionine sulfoxide reductase heme-binding subunit
VVSSAHDPISLAASHVLAAGTSGPSPLWYTTRATGVVALLLLTGTVALGVAGTARLETRAMPRLVSAGLHRNLSLLAVAFVATHVLTSVLDPFAGIGFISAVVPFTSPYRPLWVSLGAIAFDMLLALVISSLLRTRLSYRAWRGVHWLAYACWPVALWHGLGAGTDSRLSWLLLLDAVCVAVVVGAVVWRLQLVPRADVRTAGRLATAAFLLATIVFVATGPVQAGWARRAGTPARILAPPHASAVHASAVRASTVRASTVRASTVHASTVHASTVHAGSRPGAGRPGGSA